MKCPLQHEVADYRFGTARIAEGILVKICPKCGIVFVPGIEEEEEKQEEAKTTEKEKPQAKNDAKELPPEKQILKWP